MIHNILVLLLVILPLIVMMVLTHELGHYFSAKNKGYTPTLHLKRGNLVTQLPDLVPNNDMKKIIQDGITAGWVVAVFSMAISIYFPLLLMPIYYFGIRGDIKELNQINKRQEAIQK